MKLGRHGHQLTTLVVMTDWGDTGSWVDMTTDPKTAAECFLGLNVGRKTALALYHYSDQGRNSGDEFVNFTILAKKDRGVIDVSAPFKGLYKIEPKPVEIVEERLLKQIGVLDEISRARELQLQGELHGQ